MVRLVNKKRRCVYNKVCNLFIFKGKYIYSMDAIFGLPRKKSSGTSYREPLHAGIFFEDQSKVDEFVDSYGSVNSTNVRISNLVKYIV